MDPNNPTPTPTPTPTPSVDPKFEGKSQAEIMQMYAEANKKIGEQGKELETARKSIEDMNVVLAAIGDDEDLINNIKDRIANKNNPKKEEKKDKKVEKETPKSDPRLDDVRKVQEMEIIRKFEETTGISELTGDGRKEMNEKIGAILWELADPKDEYKTFAEMQASIPLHKLNKMLSTAYLLANKEKLSVQDGEKYRPVVGPFGAMSSVNRVTESGDASVELTAKQKEVAANMGISEDKFKERLQEIQKEKKERK